MRPARPISRFGLLCGVMLSGGALAQSPSEPQGYRLDGYQAVAPATVLGIPALTTEAAKALWADRSAMFIDVLPHVPKPAGLPAGTIWNDAPHRSIPGAVWLPEVGRGRLSAETEAYFARSLKDVTGGDPHRRLVIFCKRNCWMSWNATKRARSYGYDNVSWYADGVDGWSEAALPMARLEPRP